MVNQKEFCSVVDSLVGFSPRLNLSASADSQFNFKRKQDYRIIKEREDVLARNLVNLNYKISRSELRKIEKAQNLAGKKIRQVAFLSGTPNWGLRFISKKIKTLTFYKKNAVTVKSISPILIDGAPNDKIVNFFSQVFNTILR